MQQNLSEETKIESYSARSHEIFHIEDFLTQIEQPFTNSLMAFGYKALTGFESIQQWPYSWIPYGFKVLPTLYKFPESGGSFTGAGLCAVSTAALEKILTEKFGSQVTVQPMLIRTTVKDIYPSIPPSDLNYFEHTFLRLSFGNISLTLDHTYRQVNFHFSKNFLLIPSNLEREFYTYADLALQLPEKAGTFTPVFRTPGILHDVVIKRITEGKFGNATVEDYLKILEVA